MSPIHLSIDNNILAINQAICKNIDNIEASERGFLSQNILSQLRNFVEHIMLKIWQHPRDIDNSYSNICKAIEFVKTRGDLKFLRQFHDYLQIVTSHYTLDEGNSERLMLKYYEFLLKIKSFLEKNYALNVLQNLDKFPINTDPSLKKYHEKIAAKLDHTKIPSSNQARKDRYYEVTFTSTNVNASKFDRVIAFTTLDMSSFYAAKLSIG